MNKSRYRYFVLGALAFGSLNSITQSGYAAEPAEELKLEEVVITGTSIRGINPVGSTPVQYSREDIVADAPSNIGDVLANVPQIASFGTEQQLSTNNRFRTAGFIPVIHNMEIGSTLTLFNGHRMAPAGTEATFADPSMIPTIALERVEVVSDGNSAIYGTDAVAGVVNFLYRRNVDGLELDVSTTHDPNTSFKNFNASALWGKTFDRGEVMVAYEHAKHTPAVQGEFPFIADADHRAIGGRDLRTTTCDEPRVAIGMNTYSGPSLTLGTARCNPDTDLNIGFENTRDSVLATGRFRPGGGVEFWAELNYTKYDEPRDTNWGTFGVTVPTTSPFVWTPAGGTTTQQTATLAFQNIFGFRKQSATSEVQGLTLGASFDVGTAWKTDIRAHYSKTEDFWDALALDSARAASLASTGQFNPYAGAPVAASTGLNRTANSAAVIAQINNGSGTRNWGKNSLAELEVKADGPLFAISGGDVKLAVGLNHRTEALEQLQTAGCPSCSAYNIVRNDNIARGVNSVFVETAFPFVSGANSRPGIQEFTLSLAGRYDKYDKLDGVATPKIAFNYKPVESLSFHGSMGRSYAAPNLGLSTPTFAIVQLNMNTNGVLYNLYNLGGGNANLTPEKAKTWSVGLDWKPAGALDGFSAGASYYNVEYTDIIYKPGFGDLLFDPAFVSQRITNPANPVIAQAGVPLVPIDPAIMAAIMAKVPPDVPVAANQTFDYVFNTFASNMYKRWFAGIDFSVRYDWDSSIGKWGVGINANKQLVRETQFAPGAPIADDIGTYKAPVWQARFQAQWAANAIPLRINWVANYLSSYNLVNTGGWLYGGDSQLLHNLTVAYDLEKVFKGITLQARITNVLDKEPPLADTAVGYDDDNHTPYGRQYNLSIHAKF